MSEIFKRIFGNNTSEQDNGEGGDTAVIERPPELSPVNDNKPATPPMYAVLLHNDNSTSPDFVVRVLAACFSIEERRAYQIMMAAHNDGQAVVKITSKDLAETQVAASKAMIENASPQRDFFARMAPGGRCELKFSVELETKGE
jgi:ATP-dependent Clp protease adapter protein ClpS